MHERIKEHDRDIQLARTQTLAISEHANKFGHYPLLDEVKFVVRDPHWCRDSGLEIPEGWMPTNKQHNSQLVPQRTHDGTAANQNNKN